MTTSCIEFIKGHPKFVKKIHEEVVPSLKSMGTKTCAKEKQTFEEQWSSLVDYFFIKKYTFYYYYHV